MLDADDGCRALFARKQRHLAEPIFRSQDGDDFRITGAAVDDHLHRAGLNQIKSITTVALTENHRAGAEAGLFHFAEDFGDVFARQGGKNRDADEAFGLGFHRLSPLADDLVGLL